MREITLYIDENIPSVLAEALDLLESKRKSQGLKLRVASINAEFGRGCQDEEWITKVSGQAVLTQDYNLKRRSAQRNLYRDNKVQMFFIKPPKERGFTYWEFVVLTIRSWENLTDLLISSDTTESYALYRNSTKWELI
jgi:hypothetical protein